MVVHRVEKRSIFDIIHQRHHLTFSNGIMSIKGKVLHKGRTHRKELNHSTIKVRAKATCKFGNIPQNQMRQAIVTHKRNGGTFYVCSIFKRLEHRNTKVNYGKCKIAIINNNRFVKSRKGLL